MSHLLEQYAKVCGVNIGEPIIKEHYYPVIHKKYITIHADAKDDARLYSHWPIVLRLLKKPLNENGIKIIQIGGKDAKALPFVDQKITNCTYKNTFYIIKNSRLHLGVNSLPVHIASCYKKKIVNIFGNLYSECAYPYWSDKSDVINLTPDFSELKPSFSSVEEERRIDEIKPELIAASVLKLLNINSDLNFESKFFGVSYTQKCLDIVPNNSKVPNNKEIKMNIRMDKEFNLKGMLKILSLNKCEITTKKTISKDILENPNIMKVNYISSDFDLNFIKTMRKKNKKYTLFCNKKSKLGKQRAKLFDEEIYLLTKKSISNRHLKKIKNINLKDLKILSYRKILYKDKLYSSYYEISKKKEDLLLDLNNIMIYYEKHEQE